MPPKSIFRQPGARHFQLVHRSQRDPLYHDPDASKHVLKEIVRENDKKGKSRTDLESFLSPADISHDKEARVGEAALYGIYYDDTEYDYMQHLRPIGAQEDGVESVLIEAPQKAKKIQEAKRGNSQASIALRDDLPAEVLPSTSELPRNYEIQQAIPESISGFQPDMDPHLRQVLEALEDDAFVDNGMEDGFFRDLVQEGERGNDDEIEFEFREEGISDGELGKKDAAEEKGEPSTWEERFAEFKKAQKATPQEPASDDELDFTSEGGDTISGLPTMSVIGGKKRRRKGTSDASGYSMSSSTMYRNEALQTLDERFDQVLLKEYNLDEDEDVPPTSDDDDEAPQLITTREDFTSMMDEFLNEYEILGGKMKPKLAGNTAAEKLEMLRRAMGQDERVRHETTESGDEPENNMWIEEENKEDRWDCETILTTYTNLENHPRLIRARESKPVPKIQLNLKTGLPSTAGAITSRPRGHDNESDESDYSDSESRAVHKTVTRSKDETPEEKKARKAAVKAQQAARRAEKKASKSAFGNEMKAAKVRASNQPTKGVRKL